MLLLKSEVPIGPTSKVIINLIRKIVRNRLGLI